MSKDLENVTSKEVNIKIPAVSFSLLGSVSSKCRADRGAPYGHHWLLCVYFQLFCKGFLALLCFPSTESRVVPTSEHAFQDRSDTYVTFKSKMPGSWPAGWHQR